MKLSRIVLLAVLIATPVPASGQFPGGNLVGAERLRWEFAQRMQIELSGYMREWEQAWQSGSARPLPEHYLPNALVLQPDGRFVHGRSDVRSLAETLRSLVAEAATSMTDVEASDGIAYTYGPYALTPAGGSGEPEEGRVVSVLFKDRDHWYVRAQVFLAAPSSSTLSAPVGTMHLAPFSLPRGASAEFTTRYTQAMTLLGAFRSAWNERSGERAAALLTERTLLLLPGSDAPLRGAAAAAELENRLPEFGSLTTAVMDFDGRARVSYLIGRYHMQGPGGGTAGTYVVIAADEGRGMEVRALLFH